MLIAVIDLIILSLQMRVHFQQQSQKRRAKPTMTMFRRLLTSIAVLLCLLLGICEVAEAKKQRNAAHEHRVSRSPAPSIALGCRLQYRRRSVSDVLFLHARVVACMKVLASSITHILLFFGFSGQANAIQSWAVRCAQAGAKG